jgi:hypothetical protein
MRRMRSSPGILERVGNIPAATGLAEQFRATGIPNRDSPRPIAAALPVLAL